MFYFAQIDAEPFAPLAAGREWHREWCREWCRAGWLALARIQICLDQLDDEAEVDEHENDAGHHVFHGIHGGEQVDGRIDPGEVFAAQQQAQLGQP